MPSPPIPQPQYINSDIALTGMGQIINLYTGAPPTPSGFISQADVDVLIATSESQVELDLQTWYLVPFVTNTNPPLPWTDLSTATYTYLFNLFKIKSQYNIMRQYFGITGENKGDDFWITQLSLYNEMLKRFYKLDQTLNYLYPAFTDLAPNPIGMKRVLRPSKNGILGGMGTDNAEFAYRNQQRPRFNWG